MMAKRSKRRTLLFGDRFSRLGVYAFGAAAGAVTGIAGIVGGGDDASDRNASAAIDRKKAAKNLDSASAIYSALRGMGATEVQTYRKNYKPVENQAIGTAKKGLTARVLNPKLYQRARDYEGITDMRGAASRDVGRQFDISRGALTRDLSRYGVTMDSGAGTTALQSNALAEAAAKAGAMTRAGVDEATARREERRYAGEQDFNRRAYLDSENERRKQLAESETFRRRSLIGQQGRKVYDTAVGTISGAAGGLTGVGNAFNGQATNMQNSADAASSSWGSGVGDLIQAGMSIYDKFSGAPAT